MQSFLHAVRTIFGVFMDALTLYKAVFQTQSYRRSRESVFAQTACLICRAESQTATGHGRHSVYVGTIISFIRLADRPQHRQTRHFDPLASPRIPSLLEMEIAASWTTPDPSSPAEADPRNGHQQYDLERGAHRR